jgi:predicted protein tyrosine phosphatase
VNIKILPEVLAVRYCYEKDIPKTLVISIRCPGEDKPKFPKTIKENGDFNVYDIFYMEFNDLENDEMGYKAPTIDDFKGLKNFIDENITAVEQIVVHCGAGYSRSPGLALAVCEYLDIDNDIRDNNDYYPNLLVYNLAKQELGIAKNKDFYEDLFR